MPTWRTLSVLKSVTAERVIRTKGIQYGNNRFYWCSELAPLIERKKITKYRIFAFDTPFNRNISVVYDHKYIGEAHLVEKLNVVEQNRYKIIHHIRQQQAQHRFYSDKLEQLHSIVLQTDIADQVCHVPPVDNIRYGQAIDTERDSKDAIDDTSIPEALKEKAEEYSRNLMNLEGSHKKQGKITQSYRELGKKLRESKKQNRGGD